MKKKKFDTWEEKRLKAFHLLASVRSVSVPYAAPSQALRCWSLRRQGVDQSAVERDCGGSSNDKQRYRVIPLEAESRRWPTNQDSVWPIGEISAKGTSREWHRPLVVVVIVEATSGHMHYANRGKWTDAKCLSHERPIHPRPRCIGGELDVASAKRTRADQRMAKRGMHSWAKRFPRRDFETPPSPLPIWYAIDSPGLHPASRSPRSTDARGKTSEILW